MHLHCIDACYSWLSKHADSRVLSETKAMRFCCCHLHTEIHERLDRDRWLAYDACRIIASVFLQRASVYIRLSWRESDCQSHHYDALFSRSSFRISIIHSHKTKVHSYVVSLKIFQLSTLYNISIPWMSSVFSDQRKLYVATVKLFRYLH